MPDSQDLAASMDDPSAESVPALENERRAGHGWTWLMWVFVLFFIAYPLSVGPAVKLYTMKVLPAKPLESFYSPLGFVVKRFPALSRFFDWYIEDLWKALPRSAPVVSPPPQSRGASR